MHTTEVELEPWCTGPTYPMASSLCVRIQSQTKSDVHNAEQETVRGHIGEKNLFWPYKQANI